MSALLCKYIQDKQFFLYLVFGVLTTLVNILAYYLLLSTSLHYALSNALAIAASIIFAYVTNKIYVFRSATVGIKQCGLEFMRFIGSRLFAALFDMLSMFCLIEMLSCKELVSKITTGVLVVIINYILSKYFAFSQS